MVARNQFTEMFLLYIDDTWIWCCTISKILFSVVMMLMVTAYQHIPTCHDDDDGDVGNIVKIRKKASQSCVVYVLCKGQYILQKLV